jgi:hypothetical protein
VPRYDRQDKEGSLGRTDAVERDCHPEHSKGSRLALLRFAKDEKRKGRKKEGGLPPHLKIRQKKDYILSK